MATTRFTPVDHDAEPLYQELAEHDLQPLWELHGLLTSQPRPRAVPFAWHAKDLKRLAERAGELVPVDRGGDRRVLACANPGLEGAPYIVGTLWAAVQYLRVGEVAPAHRHTPAALRFVLEGEGVWTVVDGDAIPMAAGDLVLTPSWTFHEHHNSGAAPMMWLDVLDLPLVAALDAVFYEDGPSDDVQVTTPVLSRSEQRYGSGPGLLPGRASDAGGGRQHPQAASPLLAYRWAGTDRALAAQLADGATTAHVRYADPTTGADVMPTMRCEMFRYAAGSTSPTVRRTGGGVGCVLHGAGTVSIGGESFAVAPGDILAIPSWAEFHVTANDQLDLFVTSDAPVLEALGLYREEIAP
jgi:gentisate 1,2-dioxygenase